MTITLDLVFMFDTADGITFEDVVFVFSSLLDNANNLLKKLKSNAAKSIVTLVNL